MADATNKTPSSVRRWGLFTLKLVVTVGIILEIVRRTQGRDGSDELAARIADLSWGWIAAAACMQLAAITCATFRWDGLLKGQGIRASKKHLFGSFMVGRFFGAVSPGGFTGLNGYRLWDIAHHTGKTARSTATIAVEMLCGKLGMAITVIVASFFGLRYLDFSSLLVLDLAFIGLIVAVGALLAKPVLFRTVARALLGGVPTKVQTLVDAVCGYQGKGLLLGRTFLLSACVHGFNSLIYVCAAQALGVELPIGEIFFVSTVQILATLLPISINGVGLREATAAALYTMVGVPVGLAALIATSGWIVEMCISSVGGLIMLSRRAGYHPTIEVEDAEREDEVLAEVDKLEVEVPKVGRGLVIGMGAGLLAGFVIGAGEAAVVLASGNDAPDYSVLAYGAVAYGLLLMVAGAGGGLVLAFFGRLIKRQILPENKAYGRWAALLIAFPAFALGAFRVRRDIYHEELVWKSGEGLLVLAACAACAAVLYLAVSTSLRLLTDKKAGAWLLRVWGTPALVTLLIGGLAGFAAANPKDTSTIVNGTPSGAPGGAKNVLLIVVDTLRADALPVYGYAEGDTPNLDAFAQDSVRYDQAFANASWTRPSFASILTGRFASSHNVMGKPDALSDELTTMAEAFRDGGYHTAGFVTNFNVAAFFGFQQGFDHFRYLEPDFVLGANDTAAKLLFVQVLKRVAEKLTGARPGGAYQDAEVVNREVLAWLDHERSDEPFFLMAAYMDPHDPYFSHPYEGTGFSRAANQHPDAELAQELRGLYDGEITYWDEHFGQLIAGLRERGLYDDMTIIVTSDHGEEFQEHGGFWHGTTLYDEQVHVPLLVKRAYGDDAGTTVAHWVQSVDIMPTLLHENGLDPVEGVQGALLEDGTNEVYAEESHEGNVLEALRTRADGRELKVITANAGNPRGLEATELYRVDRDPGEDDNVAGDATTDLALARLEYWGGQAATGRVQRRGVEVSPEQQAQLGALGYVNTEDGPAPEDAAADTTPEQQPN